MSRKICVIPHGWTKAEIAVMRCDDQSHTHASRREADEMVQRGEAIRLKDCQIRRTAKASKPKPRYEHPGLSAKIGDYLAKRLRQRDQIARVIVEQIL